MAAFLIKTSKLIYRKIGVYVMAEQQYDLVILGGGTAGYVAAIRASQLGKKVAIVERGRLGGTCLHKGCIPTKSLLKSAEILRIAKNSKDFGVHVSDIGFDFSQMQARKTEIVNQMYQGVQGLMKQHRIDVYNGTGRILGTSIFSPQSGTISVEYEDGESELLTNQHVLITTGSKPSELPFLTIDHQQVLSSDDILSLNTLPQSIAIIGGGVIGLEFASMLIDLGVEVSVIESNKRILNTESQSIARTLKKELSARGVKFYENETLSEQSVTRDAASLTFKLSEQNITVDLCLMAVGRTPNTHDIGLNNTNVQFTPQGHIEVNAYQQTKDPHIYAAGDCIGHLQLAHAGTTEAVAAVEHMFQAQPIAVDYTRIPRCIYTYPEVASIGLDKATADAQSIDTTTYKVPFKAMGKALIEAGPSQRGFCEIIIDQQKDEVIGFNMIGPHVTELINEVALLQFMNGSTLELGRTTHAHPSISEMLMEIGLKVEQRAIHV